MKTLRHYVFSPYTIWATLILLTLAAFGIFERHFLNNYASVIILMLAALKSRMVLLHFMEIRTALKKWRLLYEGWIYVVTAMLCIFLLLENG